LLNTLCRYHDRLPVPPLLLLLLLLLLLQAFLVLQWVTE
jgi:hypothetical protein